MLRGSCLCGLLPWRVHEMSAPRMYAEWLMDGAVSFGVGIGTYFGETATHPVPLADALTMCVSLLLVFWTIRVLRRKLSAPSSQERTR